MNTVRIRGGVFFAAVAALVLEFWRLGGDESSTKLGLGFDARTRIISVTCAIVVISGSILVARLNPRNKHESVRSVTALIWMLLAGATSMVAAGIFGASINLAFPIGLAVMLAVFWEYARQERLRKQGQQGLTVGKE